MSRLFFAVAAALLVPLAVQASDLGRTIAALEQRLDARIGVAVTGGGTDWGHREGERFLMNSTVKVPLCAAVLARDVPLDENLPVRADDILEYAPVTQNHVGGSMTVADLCLATIDQSDNTAANLLFARIGGPQGLTAYLRSIGDDITRSDRIEPELNRAAQGDPDTTTPAAIVQTMAAMLPGNTQLVEWMRPGGVTGDLLRPSVPQGWEVADKSGSGATTRNLIAMLTPPDGPPIYVGLFIADTDADFAARNAALTELGAAVMQAIVSQSL